MLKNQKNKQSKLYIWSNMRFILIFIPSLLRAWRIAKSKDDESNNSLDSYALELGSMPSPHTVNLIVC